MAPALPPSAEIPASEQIPDSVLSEAIRRGELIVLGTPAELASQHGFLTPRFQLGAKETCYDVKLAVDSVLKGKFEHAKRPDLGVLPAALTPPLAFDRLAANEIIVQYLVVTSGASEWSVAAPLPAESKQSSSFDVAITGFQSAVWPTAGGHTTRPLLWSPSVGKASSPQANGRGL